MELPGYVDDHLIGTGKVQKAAILGQAGGVWAISKGYDLSTQEQRDIIESLKNPKSVEGKGIVLGGQKFFILTVTPKCVYGKKGPNGCVLVRTNQAVLVTEYTPPVQHTEAVVVVEKLADYLISVGY